MRLSSIAFCAALTLSACTCGAGGLADPCESHDDCQPGLYCHPNGTCQVPMGADGGPDAAADAGPIVGFDSSLPSTDGGGGGCGCGPNAYCDWPDDDCGEGAGGVCLPRPEACAEIWAPVCGCDGQTHGNSCEAAGMGVDVDEVGECSQPGFFACGPNLQCTQGAEYCWIALDDTGMPPIYACEALPPGCFGGLPISCACVQNVFCGDICERSDAGDVTVTCPGG